MSTIIRRTPTDYQFIQNFSRYTPENQIKGLSSIAGKVTESAVFKPNPDAAPKYPIIIVVGGIVIIVVSGPAPKPKYTPCFTELFDKVIRDKATKFDRFSKGAVQHLVISSGMAQFEIVATQPTSRRVTLK